MSCHLTTLVKNHTRNPRSKQCGGRARDIGEPALPPYAIQPTGHLSSIPLTPTPGPYIIRASPCALKRSPSCAPVLVSRHELRATNHELRSSASSWLLQSPPAPPPNNVLW